ncbi:MAG: oligosaccharide flippase family protein [Clostridia bacterium]
MNKIIKSVATVTVVGLVTRALSFLYRIILTRNISSYDLGVYQLTLSFFMVLITFTSSGVPLAISRRTSAEKNNTSKRLSEIACSGLVLTLAFAILFCGAIIAFKNIFNTFFTDKRSYDMLLICLPALVFSCVYSAFRGSLWGRKKFAQYSLVELLEELISIATLAVLFYVVKPHFDTLFYPAIAVSLSVVGASVFAFICYYINGGRLVFRKKELRPTLEISSPITFSRVLSSFASSILALLLPSRLILFGLSHKDAMSLVGLVSGVAFPLLFVPSSFISSIALVLVPEISEDLAKKRNVTAKIQKAFAITILGSSLVVPIYLTLGNEICSILFKKPEAGKYLVASAVAIIPMGLNQLAVSFLNSAGGEKYGFTNFLIGVSVAIFMVIFLTPYISIYANILSMILQPTIIFSLNLFRMSKLLKIQKRQLAKTLAFFFIIFPSILVGFFVKYISSMLPTLLSTFFTLISIFAFFALSTYSLAKYKKKSIE